MRRTLRWRALDLMYRSLVGKLRYLSVVITARPQLCSFELESVSVEPGEGSLARREAGATLSEGLLRLPFSLP